MGARDRILDRTAVSSRRDAREEVCARLLSGREKREGVLLIEGESSLSSDSRSSKSP